MTDLKKNCDFCIKLLDECDCDTCEACSKVTQADRELGSNICEECQKNMKNFDNWEDTGEILDEIDIYDTTRLIEYFSENGSTYIAGGVFSCGKLVDIEDIELDWDRS